jgi:hypothetical protein
LLHATIFCPAAETKTIGWLKAESNDTVDAKECAILMSNLLTAHDVPDVDIRVAWGLHDHDDMSIDSFLCLNDESQDVWISNERDALLIRMKLKGIKVFSHC